MNYIKNWNSTISNFETNSSKQIYKYKQEPQKDKEDPSEQDEQKSSFPNLEGLKEWFSNLFSSLDPRGMDMEDFRIEFEPTLITGITFNDVAGIDEAKEDVEELVSFLQEPEKYTKLGARIPSGILLIGPPGTGKTLLAKAIASEAKVPFFSVAGSEFVEMFVGLGAARIRDLFDAAYECAPSIIFIDEIDAIGRERGSGIGGGNDEREQTLNQLLTEMDGFIDNRGIIIIGATNRIDILDSALLRAGRFDRQINIGLPDRLGRFEILNVHAKNKFFSDEVLFETLAVRTQGFSGADLKNLLNEAAILATRYDKPMITKNEIEEAVDRVIGGIAGTTIEDSKAKRLIAYHEVGHAIIGSVLKDHDEVEKVTIVPRGRAKGLTWFLPSEESEEFISRAQLLARIASTLGGLIIEKIVFGDQEITNGASNDLQQATNIARQMVTQFGMSIIGPLNLDDDVESEQANRVDREVTKILKHCENMAAKIIIENRVIIDLVVEKLLEVETLDGQEFRELVSNYSLLPIKNQKKF